MYLFKKFFSKLFGINENDHQLCLAQYSVISSHAPLFYLLMICGMVAIAYVNFLVAPPVLTIVAPIMMLIGFLVFFNSFAIPQNLSLNDYRKSIISRLHLTVLGVNCLWYVVGLLGDFNFPVRRGF